MRKRSYLYWFSTVTSVHCPLTPERSMCYHRPAPIFNLFTSRDGFWLDCLVHLALPVLDQCPQHCGVPGVLICILFCISASVSSPQVYFQHSASVKPHSLLVRQLETRRKTTEYHFTHVLQKALKSGHVGKRIISFKFHAQSCSEMLYVFCVWMAFSGLDGEI